MPLLALSCARVSEPLLHGAAGAGSVAGSGGNAGSETPRDDDDELGGRGEPGQGFARSGQRLEARGFRVADIALFSGFYDTLLDTDCEFVRGELGEDLVCLPVATADLVYVDDQCQQPVARSQEPSSPFPSRWLSEVVQSEFTPCTVALPPRRIGYRLGEVLFSGGLDAPNHPPLKVYQRTGSSCAETTLQTGLLAPTLTRLERQPDAVFVAGRIGELRADANFSIARLHATDGAELSAFVLGADRTPCQLLPGGRCIPGTFSLLSEGAGAGEYLDDACSARAYERANFGPCPSPPLGVRVHAGEAQISELRPITQVYVKNEQIDETTGARLFDAEGNVQFSCSPTLTENSFAAGIDVTEQFPKALAATVELGPLRIVQWGTRGEGGSAPFMSLEAGATFIDRQGQACPIHAQGTKELSCTPAGPEVLESGSWADPDCKERLYYVASLDPAGEDVSLLRAQRQVANSSRELLSFTRYVGPIYAQQSTACVAQGHATSLLRVDQVTPLPSAPLVALDR